MGTLIDTATSYPDTGGTVAVHTFSHICTSASILFLGFVHYTDNTDDVSAVTYAGQTMTRINTVPSASAIGRGYLYYLSNPPAGSNTVSITLTGARLCYAASVSYRASASTIDSSNTGSSASSASFTISTTTVAPSTWVVSCFYDFSGRIKTAGVNTTERINQGAVGGVMFCDSNTTENPAGSYSQNITETAGDLGGSIASFAAQASSAAIMLFI